MGLPGGNHPDDRKAGGRTPRRAAFLDRDGVLNEDVGFLHDPANFRWVEGAREAVGLLNRLGVLVVVVTNQSGVARGMFDEAAVRALHGWMTRELAAVGARIDAFYYCPHHPTAGRGEYRIACDCRKPAPGLYLRAMDELAIGRAGSFAIGDQPRDLEAAAAAGIPGHHFSGGNLLHLVERLVADGA